MLGGAATGSLLRRALPDHHLDEHAKDIVRLGAGLVATISALVLGLLISSASSSYEAQRNEVRQMAANLILLDEPTNDLDLSTLRVLEEALVDYDGAVIVVTHDRAFLDRVCTGLLAFHGDGRVVRYASRQQWLAALSSPNTPAAPQSAAEVQRPATEPRRRLSYREQQALAALPAQIDTMEQRRAALERELADPATWKAGRGQGLSRELADLAARIEAAYTEWTKLESRQ